MTKFPRAAQGKPRHLIIILNLRASQRRMARYRAVLAGLDAAGCTYEIKEITAAGDAARYAAEASAEMVDVIAVAGGDGTINDAINGLGEASPPLGLIPLGTANVLAHEIGLETDPAAIVAALASGNPLAVTPGQVNGRRFMMMTSVGFDAHVVSGVRGELKRRIGKFVYALSALRQLIRYPCPHLAVMVDGEPIVAATLVVSRGRLYGGRFVMAPNADLRKPELTVSIFRRKGRLAMAGYSAALPMGLLNRWKLIDHVSARCVEVFDRHGDPVQADGDIVTMLPARIGLADHPIRLIVPSGADAPACAGSHSDHRTGSTTKTTCLVKS